MRRKVAFTVEAENDITEIAVYVGADNRDAAERFLAGVADATKRLVRTPKIGAVQEFDNPTLGEIYMIPMDRPFQRHLLFYWPTLTSVTVIRVLHTSREIEAIFGQRRKK